MDFEFISVREAAEKNGVTQRWIQQLCKDGKIEGTIRLGGTGPWLIPAKWKNQPSSNNINENNF